MGEGNGMSLFYKKRVMRYHVAIGGRYIVHTLDCFDDRNKYCSF